MGNKTLYILRGVSGCGKTTLAKTLENTLKSSVAFAADDYFCVGGEYKFDTSQLNKAHKWCQDQVAGYMNKTPWQKNNIIVHNTNTSHKEVAPYIELAAHFGYKVVSLVVENLHGNTSVHDVPVETLEKQERKLKNSLKLI